MLSEEEKKAIEVLFHLAHINTYLDLEKEDVVKISRPIITQWKEKTEIVLNLIEKQSEEIERLEARKYMFNAETGEISQIPLNNNYINKDKIREKIEDLEKQDKESKLSHNYLIIPVLQSLLEEE